MRTYFWNRPEWDLSRPKTFLYTAMFISAGVVGLAAVEYARLIAHLQNRYFEVFREHPIVVSLASPFLFVLATSLVKKLAPDAKGSGIPQVLVAIENAKDPTAVEGVWKSNLVSLKTAVIKVLSSSFGILAGASIGREGPTVQLAASGFVWIGHKIRKYAPQIDIQSFLIAGAGAGVAAAFNTPIAGIAFALEEIADGMQRPFRQMVMLAVIIAGMTAQGLSGNYLYFGEPKLATVSVPLYIMEAIILGLLGGLLGGLFAKFLTQPKLSGLPNNWIMRSFIAGAICSAMGYFTAGDTAGSGYEFTRNFLNGNDLQNASLLFPGYKFLTTVFSYLSGMAGGIFSPCLSIGAGLGLTVAKLFSFVNFKACALIGMVGFFSGAVRAPLTAVIIVMEMTNEHNIVLPLMIAAYLAHSLGSRIMPVPLYHYLAHNYLRANHPEVTPTSTTKG